ncbi:hypothetical protein JOD67_004957 [Tenggerimyces flavus]|nr:hypothetical protein [Tenggerimyces flavus]
MRSLRCWNETRVSPSMPADHSSHPLACGITVARCECCGMTPLGFSYERTEPEPMPVIMNVIMKLNWSYTTGLPS